MCDHCDDQVLMYLRSAKDKRTDVAGDESLLPKAPDIADWPLKTPAKTLHELAEKAKRSANFTHSPRGALLARLLVSSLT